MFSSSLNWLEIWKKNGLKVVVTEVDLYLHIDFIPKF